MSEIINLKEEAEQIERVILVGVCTGDESEAIESLDELDELVRTAGALPVAKVIQNLDMINRSTYVGKGKLEEIRDLIQDLDATGIICDDELSPSQIRNIEDIVDSKVMDRTLVVLDIFAGRAITREGKIQVELAQLKYRAPRLIGMRNSLSRLGGGIGTKGPGEKKLEMDRRLIRERISILTRELDEVKQHREIQRRQRTKDQMPVVCIVGYTNAGKSTLLNHLTDAGVLEEDKLFATLDPTTRNMILPSGQQIMMTDTVGFIRKLPHHLVEAFKSTLEEARYSDIILHVVDCSNELMDKQIDAVYETLQSLEITDKPIITAFNKADLVEEVNIRDERAHSTVLISAKQETGFSQLFEAIENILRLQKIYIEKMIPYDQANQLQLIRKYGQLLEEDYQNDGIFIRAYMPKTMKSIL